VSSLSIHAPLAHGWQDALCPALHLSLPSPQCHCDVATGFPPGNDGNGAAGTKPLVSASAFIHDAQLVSEMAGAVGDVSIQKEFSDLHGTLAKEFNALWLKNGSYGSGCQTDLAIPLWLGIVPPHSRAAVVESLVKNIQQHSYHTTSGILGARAQYEALAKNGRMDVALAMLNKTDFPSYGYMVANADEPATTLWEKCAYSFHSVEGCAALVCAAAEHASFVSQGGPVTLSTTRLTLHAIM
jgi:hypothetical protein